MSTTPNEITPAQIREKLSELKRTAAVLAVSRRPRLLATGALALGATLAVAYFIGRRAGKKKARGN